MVFRFFLSIVSARVARIVLDIVKANQRLICGFVHGEKIMSHIAAARVQSIAVAFII